MNKSKIIEWHYPKNGEFPKKNERVLGYLKCGEFAVLCNYGDKSLEYYRKEVVAWCFLPKIPN